MREPEVFLAITDSELIVTTQPTWGAKAIHIFSIGEQPLSYDVLTWINFLSKDGGEAMGSR